VVRVLFCFLAVCNKGTSLSTRETEGHKASKFFLESTLKKGFQYFAEDCILFIQLMWDALQQNPFLLK
jgi:hypothetical protein